MQKEVIVFVTVGIANPADLPKDAGLPKNAVLGRQFVDGTKLEPGDRKDAAVEMLKIDTRAVDDPSGTTRRRICDIIVACSGNMGQKNRLTGCGMRSRGLSVRCARDTL